MTARSNSALRDRLFCSAPLRHFGIWQAMVAMVSSCALATLLAWMLLWPVALGLFAQIVVALSFVAVISLAVSLVRVEAGTLS
ncbi:MAG: hypothetical protein ABI281_11175, partial [Caldimonas sp.]